MRLYKDRYLIAVYDKFDHLIEVGANTKELEKNHPSLHSCLNHLKTRGRLNKDDCKYHLIDVYEKHDDIFSEEDKIFVEWVKQNTKPTDAEIAKKMGINIRTYYRRKAQRRKYEQINASTK